VEGVAAGHGLGDRVGFAARHFLLHQGFVAVGVERAAGLGVDDLDLLLLELLHELVVDELEALEELECKEKGSGKVTLLEAASQQRRTELASILADGRGKGKRWNMKTYMGYGHRPEVGGAADVYVQSDGGEQRPLEHKVLHSPDGFSWGYGGSGPADLARSLLWDALGAEPQPWLYQRFKAEYVATWPMAERACWSVTSEELQQWAAKQTAFAVR